MEAKVVVIMGIKSHNILFWTLCVMQLFLSIYNNTLIR